MKRIGLVLILLGIVAFVVASSQRKGYDTVQGAFKAAFSQRERSTMELWDNARWGGIALAAVGAVLLLVPRRAS